jgi:hypothetical protein
VKKLILALLALGMLLAGNCSRPVVPPQPVTLDGSAPVMTDAAPPLLDAAPAPAPTVVADAAPPPPAPDAGPVPVPLTPVGAACFNLAAIGCSDGKAPSCVATLQHVVDFQAANGKRAPPLACLTGAKDPKTAKACGFVSCK